MDVSDRQLNLLKARAENLVQPGEVRRIRKKLDLNQQRAGSLLRGGLEGLKVLNENSAETVA